MIEYKFEALQCRSNAIGRVIRPFAINDEIIFEYDINKAIEDNNDKQSIELCLKIEEKTGVRINPADIISLVKNKNIIKE